MKRRILSILIVFMIIFSHILQTASVFAVTSLDKKESQNENSKYTKAYLEYLALPDEKKAEISAIPPMYEVPLDILYEDTVEVKEEPNLGNLFGLFAQTSLKANNSDELPASYNLADYINILIKDQGKEGLCWAYTSNTVMETYMALNGYGECDLSERHIDYIESEKFASLGLLGKDRKLGTNGNIDTYYIDYLSNFGGPVLESDFPNREYDETEYDNLVNAQPVIYVGELAKFPTIDVEKKLNNEYTDEVFTLLRQKIKQHIMKKGAIYASITSPQVSKDKYYNMENHALCITEKPEDAMNYSHAVTIIGWDDNFSKDKFNDGYKPKKDGAYICLNSWGPEWAEGDHGIFYLSYEDIYAERGLKGIDYASTNKEDVISHYTTEKVEFNDNNLYNAIKKQVKYVECDDTKLTLYIRPSTLRNTHKLDLSNLEIVDLKGIEKFIQCWEINLSDNKITNITPLVQILKNLSNENEFMELLDLSNNNIGNSIALLANTCEILKLKLNNCGLTSIDIQNLQNIKWKNKIYLQLRKNNLQNVSALNDIPATLGSLDLSENKNINISTIPITEELILEDCNITDLSTLNVSDNSRAILLGRNKQLNLSTIPKVDILSLRECDLTSIANLSIKNDVKILELSRNPDYKDVTELGALQNLDVLYLIGNKNLTNLDKLIQIKTLYLCECDLTDYSDIANLPSLETLDVSDNKITQVMQVNNPKLSSINLDNNQIMDIVNVPSNVVSITNQIANIDIDIKKGVENRFEQIGKVIADTKKNEYQYPAKITLENCTMDYENEELIINSNETQGIAKVSIEGGIYSGYNCTINFNTIDNLTPSYLKVIKQPSKTVYVEGEDFDADGMIVRLVYSNGSSENITNYTLTNTQNLQKNQNTVSVIYANTISEDIPITVYKNSEVEKIKFDDKNLYEHMIYQINTYTGDWGENAILGTSNKDKEIMLVPGTLTKVQGLIIEDENISNLSGLSKLSNLEYLYLRGGKFTDLTELNNLSKLKTLEIKNNTVLTNIDALANCPALNYTIILDGLTNVQDINALSDLQQTNNLWLYIKNMKMPDANVLNTVDRLVLNNVTNLDVDAIWNNQKIKTVSINQEMNAKDLIVQNNKLFLPDYIQSLSEKGHTIKAYLNYVEREDMFVQSKNSKELPIETVNGLLAVEMDKEISENKSASERSINVVISGGMIYPNEKSELKINYELSNPIKGLEVSVLPTKTTYKAGDTFDLSGIELKRIYTNEKKEIINDLSKVTVTPNGVLTKNDKSVKLEYTENNITVSSAVNIKVNEIPQSIIIETQPSKTIYTEGEEFNPSGMVVQKVYSDNTKENITNYEISPNTALTKENTEITISYKEDGMENYLIAKVNITVNPVIMPSPSPTPSQNPVNNTKIEYIIENNEKYIISINEENNRISDILTKQNFPEAQTLKAKDKNGQELKDNERLGTGSVIELLDSTGKVIDKYTIAIKGDLDGNGKIDLYDILKLIELVLDNDTNYNWTVLEKISGETDGDKNIDKPNLYDIVRLMEYFFDGIKW